MIGSNPFAPPGSMIGNIRVGFAPSSPQMRLTVTTYLLDAGYLPGDNISNEDFIATVESIVNYATADYDEYMEVVEDALGEDRREVGIDPLPFEGNDGDVDFGGYV